MISGSISIVSGKPEEPQRSTNPGPKSWCCIDKQFQPGNDRYVVDQYRLAFSAPFV